MQGKTRAAAVRIKRTCIKRRPSFLLPSLPLLRPPYFLLDPARRKWALLEGRRRGVAPPPFECSCD